MGIFHLGVPKNFSYLTRNTAKYSDCYSKLIDKHFLRGLLVELEPANINVTEPATKRVMYTQINVCT